MWYILCKKRRLRRNSLVRPLCLTPYSSVLCAPCTRRSDSSHKRSRNDAASSWVKDDVSRARSGFPHLVAIMLTRRALFVSTKGRVIPSNPLTTRPLFCAVTGTTMAWMIGAIPYAGDRVSPNGWVHRIQGWIFVPTQPKFTLSASTKGPG